MSLALLPRLPRVLLLEDSDIDADLIQIHLERSHLACTLVRAARRIDYESALATGDIDLVLADYSLPDFNGLDALHMARAVSSRLPFIFVSGVGGEELATDALLRGATDYVLKRNLVRLGAAVTRALAEAHERAQRELAEQALVKSEAAMRIAVDAAELGLWQFDARAQRLQWDARSRQMFGALDQDLIDYPDFLARVHESDRAAVDAALQQALGDTSSGMLRHEYRVRLADGTLRWIVMRGQRLQPSEMRDARLSGVLQDMTLTRTLEARQRHTELLFRLAAQATGLGVWELGPDMDEFWFDDVFRDMAGLPQSAQPRFAEYLHEAVHADDRLRVERLLREALRGGDSAEVEIEHRMPPGAEGHMRWVALKGRHITDMDGHGRLVGTVRDATQQHHRQQALRVANAELEVRVAERTRELTEEITERGRVEDTLRQMQRLEAVGQLTSGVAHDFNNLLMVVLSNISLVRRLVQKQPGTDPRVEQRLTAIVDAVERGAALIRQLLAFSRRQRLEPQQVDFNEVVLGMRDLLQTTIGGSVHLQTELAQDLWPAMADPTQLELIILNLVINARDAMQVGGSLRIRTGNLRSQHAPARSEEPEPGEYAVLSVIDTGSGMTEAVLAKAFEPFFTTKDVGKGSGLGLAQVYGFAKQSGGGVRIDTELGKGTAIHVFMPRYQGAAAPLAGDATALPAPRDTTSPHAPQAQPLLLVDDDDGVRETTAALLQLNGFQTLEASNGQDALALLQAHEDIALVVADFAMPQLNGVELAGQIHALRPTLPVLFMTGFADLAALEGTPEDLVLQKPIDEQRLVQRLRELLARR